MEKLGKFAKSLRQGQTIYKVFAIGSESRIETYRVASKAKFRTNYLYWAIMVYGENDTYPKSLLDMNAMHGLNGYNNHRAFYSKKKAEKYLKTCKEFNIHFDEYYSDCDNDYCGCY